MYFFLVADILRRYHEGGVVNPENEVVPRQPVEPGPIGGLVTDLIGPPILFCLASFFGILGALFLAAVLCETDNVPFLGVCVAVIIGFYVYMWAEDVGLLPAIGLVACLLSLTASLSALLSGNGGGATLGLCFALVTLTPSIYAARKTKIKRSEGGWIQDVIGAYFFLCVAAFFLGGLCLVVAGLLFGLDVALVDFEVTATDDFPFVGLNCCRGTDTGSCS